MHKTTKLTGFVKTVAEHDNPLQTKLSLILTDFEPNANNQAIPLKEKEQIIRSARNAPLKINFDGIGYAGHSGAFPVGPIINVREDINSDGKPIIVGDAVIWKELFPDLVDHLKSVFAEGIGSSWEIYYRDAEKDDRGIDWLIGCEFAGTCIVEVPAYGPERTKVLAIAEKYSERVNQTMSLNLYKSSSTTSDTANTSNFSLNTHVDDQAQTDVSVSFSDLFVAMYKELFGVENIDIEVAMSEVHELVTSLRSELQTKSDELQTAVSELAAIKQERENEIAEAAKKEKLKNRRQYLSESGLDISDDDWSKREEFYAAMDDVLFETYVADIKSVKLGTAEKKPIVLPEPRTGESYDTKAIVDGLRNRKK